LPLVKSDGLPGGFPSCPIQWELRFAFGGDPKRDLDLSGFSLIGFSLFTRGFERSRNVDCGLLPAPFVEFFLLVLDQPFQVCFVADNSVKVFSGRKQLRVAHFARDLHFPLKVQLEFFFEVSDFLIERLQELLTPVFLRGLGLLLKVSAASLVGAQ
jgi:hypothetical protein